MPTQCRVRPCVDIVVPFAGTTEAMTRALGGLCALKRNARDTVTLVDNRPRRDGGPVPDAAGVRVLRAPERQSSYFARNRGAAAGKAEWLLFLDADVEVPPSLVADYFERPVAADVGVLAGGIADEGADDAQQGIAARYAYLRRTLDQSKTLDRDRPYAQTANCAVRRTAFEQVGGFNPDLRSGGDADFCFRAAEAGWRLEPRLTAIVVHRGRRRVVAMLGQIARHGSGVAWLDSRHGGFQRQREGWGELAIWTGRRFASGVRSLIRRDRDQAILDFFDPLTRWAFRLGRLVPNRPVPRMRRLVGAGRGRGSRP